MISFFTDLMARGMLRTHNRVIPVLSRFYKSIYRNRQHHGKIHCRRAQRALCAYNSLDTPDTLSARQKRFYGL